MRDPGLDRHGWETEWESLQEQLEESPAEALPDVGDLIERMLRDNGIPIDDEVADDGIEREVLVDYREARRITDAVERGDDVGPGDIGAAVRLYRELYRYMVTEFVD